MTRGLLIPREHGAWGMLLLPFVSALVLARRLEWEVIPAAVVAVGIFLAREPLVILWRQATVWKERREETRAARSSLLWYAAALMAGGSVLFWRLPLWPVVAMGALAATLTAGSVYWIVHNRQRSLPLQLTSAAGLSASAILAWLAARGELDPAAGWLWALQFAHSAAALLAVRARLEARIASRAGADLAGIRRRAMLAQVALLAAAAGCALSGHALVALALAISGTMHAVDLKRLSNAAFLQTPLRRVGYRELSLSVVFSALVLAGLW